MTAPRPVPDHTVITGAAGWLGRALIARLACGGASGRGGVVALVLDNDERAAVRHDAPGVHTVVGDITRPDDLAAVLGECTGTIDVIHTAGVIHPARTSEFEAVNAGGTRNVLDAARRAGARRVVHVSSNSPFGTNADVEDTFRRHEPYHPYQGYGTSKMRVELHVREAVEAGALDAVIVRPPWFYGPYQPARQATFLTMVRRGRFPVVGSGRQRRSMVYIENLVDGVLLAELTEAPAGSAWWIADERPYPLHEIVETVGAALSDEGYHVRRNRVRLPAIVGRLAEAADRLIQSTGRYQQAVHVLGEMDKTIAVDITAAVDELGYRPAVGLYEGMRASIAWCRAQGIEL